MSSIRPLREFSKPSRTLLTLVLRALQGRNKRVRRQRITPFSKNNQLLKANSTLKSILPIRRFTNRKNFVLELAHPSQHPNLHMIECQAIIDF